MQRTISSAGTHRSNGHYTIPLDATDTNTLGQLTLTIKDAAPPACLPVRHDFMVIPANAYDALVLGTDVLTADVTQLNGVAASAAKLEKSASGIIYGTTYSSGGTTTYFETASITEATADHYIGRVVIFLDGALQYQATSITDYALASGRGAFTVATLTDAVPNGTSFVIV